MRSEGPAKSCVESIQQSVAYKEFFPVFLSPLESDWEPDSKILLSIVNRRSDRNSSPVIVDGLIKPSI